MRSALLGASYVFAVGGDSVVDPFLSGGVAEVLVDDHVATPELPQLSKHVEGEGNPPLSEARKKGKGKGRGKSLSKERRDSMSSPKPKGKGKGGVEERIEVDSSLSTDALSEPPAVNSATKVDAARLDLAKKRDELREKLKASPSSPTRKERPHGQAARSLSEEKRAKLQRQHRERRAPVQRDGSPKEGDKERNLQKKALVDKLEKQKKLELAKGKGKGSKPGKGKGRGKGSTAREMRVNEL
eukprot:CAMPEP_0194515620 /NCGR_PEP_ID=MMETSP0253-20130528/48366_1 /TAXON_ID=2966 /ORGANISM="Noctiluca scintillans" /LENGTH=241 /DNA_ID=CAMNT_0039359387 /DNA_START=11 /DNA_END=736 /DNA_ORIENTATION=+